jgi:hypothetical protein
MGVIKYNISIGDRFEKLIVIERRRIYNKNGESLGFRWICKCDCGNITLPQPSEYLFNGKTTSCGKSGCKKAGGGQKKVEGDKNPSRLVYLRYKRQAKDRKIEFKMTYEIFVSLVCLPCYYCGDETKSNYKSPKKKNDWETTFYYTGIDRINSDQGYIENNIRPCCKYCNRAKSDRTEKDFLIWIEKTFYKMSEA